MIPPIKRSRQNKALKAEYDTCVRSCLGGSKSKGFRNGCRAGGLSRLSLVPGIKMFVVSACDSAVGYTTHKYEVLLVTKQYQKDGLLNDIGRSSS